MAQRRLTPIYGRTSVLAVLILGALIHVVSGRCVASAIRLAAPRVLGVNVTIRKATVYWLTGRIVATDLVVSNPKGFDAPNLCEVHGIDINLAVTSIFRHTFTLDDVRVDKPVLTYERKHGTSNLDALQKLIDAKRPQSSKKGSSPVSEKTYSIRHLGIHDITVGVDLGGFMSKPMTLPLPNIDMTDLGNANGGMTPSHIAGKITQALIDGIGNALAGAGPSGSMKDVSKGIDNLIDQADEGVRNAAKSLQGLLQ